MTYLKKNNKKKTTKKNNFTIQIEIEMTFLYFIW